MNANRLTAGTAALLLVPPLMWAGNAVVGRMATGLISPITLNFLRWLLAFVLLLPFTWPLLRPSGSFWPLLRLHWRRYALLGLLGMGLYNCFQYMALKTSTPLNVTLVAASAPVFMLAIGKLFFGQTITPRQVIGAVMSIAGVLLVMSRGDWQVLARLQWVIGDIYILLATLAWSWYSWMLSQPNDPAAIRSNWAAFLLAQLVFGLGWSGLFSAGEWTLDAGHFQWGWPLAATLAFVSVCPAIIAYRCYGLGVQRVGPNVAAFFTNFTPLIAALLSAAILGEMPKLYHALAFLLIVGGIWVSSRRP
jgi:drug/metabolite transporter (DMT)-like permease